MTKKRRKNPLSPNMARQLKKAKLPQPVQQMSAAQYAKLQKKWYAILADDGFEDIEWVDHKTGKGHNSGFLKGSLISGKIYHPGRDLYFQLASNYLLHCKALKEKPYERFIWKHHANGLTYAEVQKEVKDKYGKAQSMYTIYYQLRDLAKLCYKWNQTHPEGLLVKRAEDKKIIDESGVAEFYKIEYNWLQNEQFAAQEKYYARQSKKNFRT